MTGKAMVGCWENHVYAIKFIKNAMSTWPHGYDTFFSMLNSFEIKICKLYNYQNRNR